MADGDEYLAMRRPKRSTAGNRMEAALAEMTTDDMKDADDDNDFFVEKDEEDMFESDFESTDEEAAAQEDVVVGETAVQEEEKRARKTARSRVEKATALAHVRNKATFNPQELLLSSKLEAPRRRVSMGTVIDAETGEVIESSRKSKRQSQRKHTVLNTSATVTRMRNAEVKKATAIPKKVKIQTRAPTQDELIARALDNEEGNMVEHRDYLQLEEEKRRRAQVVRASIHGPVLRWISRGEKTKVLVDPLRAPYGYLYPTTPNSNVPNSTIMSSSGQTAYPYSSNGTPYLLPMHPAPPSGSFNQSTGQSPYIYPPQPIERTEKLAKNYVLHELGQYEGVPKPPWTDTMESMFGDRVNWEEMRVYVGKGRPFSRPKQVCLLTGQPARYRDPRTGVPYANANAYQILTRILAHEYIWSESLGCYIGAEGSRHAQGIVGNVRSSSMVTEDAMDVH